MAQVVDERGNPTSLSSYQKNELYRQAKDLKEKVRESLCSREECRNPTDRNVEKMIRSEFAVKKEIETFKKQMKAIGADPKDYNIERFRR